MLRHLPNHGTIRLLSDDNDDNDDYGAKSDSRVSIGRYRIVRYLKSGGFVSLFSLNIYADK